MIAPLPIHPAPVCILIARCHPYLATHAGSAAGNLTEKENQTMNRRALLTALGLAPMAALPAVSGTAVAAEQGANIPAQETAIRRACDAVFAPGGRPIWVEVQARDGNSVWATKSRLERIIETANSPYISIRWDGLNDCVDTTRFLGKGQPYSSHRPGLGMVRASCFKFAIVDDAGPIRSTWLSEGGVFAATAERVRAWADGKLIIVSEKPPMDSHLFRGCAHIVVPA
jgi:hypothetical protein